LPCVRAFEAARTRFWPVTADPAEGSRSPSQGSNLVEAVAMPPKIIEAIAQFITEHHSNVPSSSAGASRRRSAGQPRQQAENTP